MRTSAGTLPLDAYQVNLCTFTVPVESCAVKHCTWTAPVDYSDANVLRLVCLRTIMRSTMYLSCSSVRIDRGCELCTCTVPIRQSCKALLTRTVPGESIYNACA